MKCPKCGSDTRVTDTRMAPKRLKRRRRLCKKCGHRTSSYEVMVEEGQTIAIRAGMADGVYELIEIGRVRGVAIYTVGTVIASEVK